MQGVHPGIIQHIRAVSALRTQPEIIDVPRHAIFEHGDQLVLRTIETALAGVGLVPDQ